MVDHPSKAFKSDIFRRGKPKQQGRQLLQKELPVQAARRGAWRRLQGMGGPWPPYPADGDDNVSDGVWPAGPEDREGCLEGQLMSFHDQPQSNTCRYCDVKLSGSPLCRGQHCFTHKTLKRTEQRKNQSGHGYIVMVRVNAAQCWSQMVSIFFWSLWRCGWGPK